MSCRRSSASEPRQEDHERARALLVLAEWGDQLILLRDTRLLPAILSASTLLAAAALFVGLSSRLSALWTAASATGVLYVFGAQHGRDFIHNHTHMLVLALWLLALTPCGVSYSVDRWSESRRARRLGQPLSPERAFLWAQQLLVVHLSTVYVWGVYAKRVPAFLNGARLEQLYMTFYGSSEFPSAPLFHPLMVATSWSVIALELFLAIGIWFGRTRPYAIGLGIVFHLRSTSCFRFRRSPRS